jgi:DNA-binding NarL/FixJ family response regulator
MAIARPAFPELPMSMQLAASISPLDVPYARAHALSSLSRNSIRILCIESQPVFREGLRSILQSEPSMQLVSEAASSDEAIAHFKHYRPDITLMDVHLTTSDGFRLLEAIRVVSPKARVVVLTSSESQADLCRAMRAGASGYLLKSMSKARLLESIRLVHAGRRHVCSELAMKLVDRFVEEDLTAREVEVLECIRDGFRTKQIADVLNIAETTVTFHIKNLVKKLKANDRTHAVTIAFRRGLIPVGTA